MLYPTVNQPIIIVVIFLTGLLCGGIFDIFKLLTAICGNDKITKSFFDFLTILFSFFIFFFVNLKINYGQFRIYVIVLFIAGLTLERLIIKLIWCKLIKKWYSAFNLKQKKMVEKSKNYFYL